MNIIQTIIQFIDNHSGMAIVIAWLIYRFGIWNERKGIINAIDEELENQKKWFESPHYTNTVNTIRFTQFTPATTNAIDNAIIKGPFIFLNNKLVASLVSYRQSIHTFNQIVNIYQSFSLTPDLWDSNDPDKNPKNINLHKHALDLLHNIHDFGIGNERNSAAHTTFIYLREQVLIEKKSKILPIIWLITGINLFRLKEFICKYF